MKSKTLFLGFNRRNLQLPPIPVPSACPNSDPTHVFMFRPSIRGHKRPVSPPKWSKMAKNGLKWPKLTKTDQKWPKTAKMATNGPVLSPCARVQGAQVAGCYITALLATTGNVVWIPMTTER